MIKFLPVLLLLSISCNFCKDDYIGSNPNYDYHLIVKTDSSNSFRELIYNESDVHFYTTENQLKIPVSYLKTFRVYFKTKYDSGVVVFTPILNSEVWANDCETSRSIIFRGMNFSSNDYPNSILKSSEYSAIPLGSSFPSVYNKYDTLILIK